MEPEEIEALIAAERAKSVSDDAILSRLRFQGIDATEYLKKKDETEGSSSVSGSETGNMASVSSISPFLGQTDTSSVGLVADPPLLANAWDIASPEDRESLHISPEYYDGYQKAGFIELANTVQQYNLPNITEVYQSFLSNNESWFTSVPKGVDALASELIQNEQFIEEHLGGVATTIDSYAYGSQGGIGGVSLPPIQRSTEAIEQDRTKIAKKFLNQALLDATANALRNNMPDNVKGDEKALEYMEQYMLENYRSMIDLSGDGTVGNTPFLQFDGFETWRSGDVVGVAPQFSGYLADKFEAAGIDIINSVYNFFGGSAKNVSERREEAERIREETLQFQNGVGESFSNNDFINGIKQIAGYTEGFNESARQGHLSSVFGTDMVATGASSLFFLRALRGVKGGAPGAAASDWWKYHLANAGYSVPVTGVTGGLAAMSNYVSIMERTGQEIVWADVRQIGLDVSISAGVSIGPAGAINKR